MFVRINKYYFVKTGENIIFPRLLFALVWKQVTNGTNMSRIIMTRLFPRFHYELDRKVTWYTHSLLSCKERNSTICSIEVKMSGGNPKAVCVLLPNDSPVKGVINFEQVSRKNE